MSRSPPILSWQRRWLRGWASGLLLLAISLISDVHAQSRAWLDRDVIQLGETVTLSIEADISKAGALPDPYTLTRDFRLVGQESGQRIEFVNGKATAIVTMSLTLQPLREGVLTIPMISFGSQGPELVQLTVLPAPATQSLPRQDSTVDTDSVGNSSDPSRHEQAFIETAVDIGNPYVQQTVGYVVRIHYIDGALIDGRLEQEAPDGASLQKHGDDLEYTREIDGQVYKVLERRYLLVPERPGRIVVPRAKFSGNGILNLFGGILGGGRGEVELSGSEYVLEVRPLPKDAPQPWLPLQGLRLRYLEAPQQLRVGEAGTVVVEAVVDGATAGQLPALELKVDDKAQVLAEAPQADERFVDTRPQVVLTRRFSVIAERGGALRVIGPRLEWWDAKAGLPRTAALPDLRVETAGADGKTVADNAIKPANEQAQNKSEVRTPFWPRLLHGGSRLWWGVGIAIVWLVLLYWGWRSWRTGRWSNSAATSARRGPVPPPLPQLDAQTWKRVLETGDLTALSRMLCEMSTPKAGDLDKLRHCLADPAQRAAIDLLQQARWGGGDLQAARNKLRAAFADGPRWVNDQTHSAGSRRHDRSARSGLSLPPLYPK